MLVKACQAVTMLRKYGDPKPQRSLNYPHLLLQARKHGSVTGIDIKPFCVDLCKRNVELLVERSAE